MYCAFIGIHSGLWDQGQQFVENNIPQQKTEDAALGYASCYELFRIMFPFTKTLRVSFFQIIDNDVFYVSLTA